MGVHHQVSWLIAGSSTFNLLKIKIICYQSEARSWMWDAWLFARNSSINLLKKNLFFIPRHECGQISLLIT